MNRTIPVAIAGRGHVGCPLCTIIPEHMLSKLSEAEDAGTRTRARYTLQHTERLRGHREVLSLLGAVALATPTGTKRRTIYDTKTTTTLPGALVRSEGAPKSKDVAVNNAYDLSGTVYDFYQTVFNRTSVDGKGMRLDSTVHYGKSYDNAFWNGMQMVYGDGDGVIFQNFTKCLDVIGHELTHGVTQYEAGLQYQGQPGALNESCSDVFGVLIKQWKLGQTAAQADWLIGAGLLAKGIKGVALRSMKAPGTAYNDPHLGQDPQPADMKHFYKGTADNGGVHINSGIPNHVFYLVATAIGGKAWDRAGRIWYDALCNRFRPDTNFKDAAAATIASSTSLFGATGVETRAVKNAWKAVGVI